MEETIPETMIFDSTTASSDCVTVAPDSNCTSHQCKVCGAPALHSNYGAMTCDSCKIFFRRHVTRDQQKIPCRFNGDCEVNIHNRHTCSSCRLTKCFENGMKADLIRCPRPKKNTMLNVIIKEDKPQQFPTTNLLQSDNSTLTANEWTLLSNLISSYDETKLVSIGQQFINESNVSQSLTTIDPTLPKEFFKKTYEITGECLQSNSDFRTLSCDDRSAFLRNAADNVTCLGAMLSWSWPKVYNCQPFIQIFEEMYGTTLLPMIKSVLKLIDPDIIVAKLSLSLFAFSNNISIFSSNYTRKSINTLAVVNIQNTYAELTWKYLLYKYGYYRSIQRFNNLTQCLLAATVTVFNAQNIEKHVNDIQSLIEQIELTLVLDDSERID